MAALMHRKSASTGTYSGSCGAQDSVENALQPRNPLLLNSETEAQDGYSRIRSEINWGLPLFRYKIGNIRITYLCGTVAYDLYLLSYTDSLI